MTYWEGSVSAKGTAAGGRPVSAEGYVELTGTRERWIFSGRNCRGIASLVSSRVHVANS